MKFKFWNNDPNLSLMLQKHPDTVFTRNLRDNTTVTAYWKDGRFYGVIEHDIEQILIHCKQTNMASYNDAVFWVCGPYNLTGFDTIFRSALRGKYDESITEQQSNTPYLNHMTIGPVSEFNQEKINRIANGMGLFIERTPDDKTFTSCMIHISGVMPVTEFLQKVYIFLYAYQYEYNLGKDTDDKLEKLRVFFENWIDEVVDKEYLIKLLSGHRLYKYKNLDTEFGESEEQRVENKSETSLHHLRHESIAKALTMIPFNQIVDLGCGDGQVLKHYKILGGNETYIGLDTRISHKTRKGKKGNDNIKFYETNILYPYLPDYDRNKKTTLILSEVIEHFDLNGRKMLYYRISDFYQPDTIILTTPNVSYNKYFGIEGYRHKDHKIEFDYDGLWEIKDCLRNYHWYEIKLYPDAIMSEQPSFILIGHRLNAKSEQTNSIESIKQLYPHDHRTNMDINKGLCNRAFVQNGSNIFYMGPTISPANPSETELESVESGINYYKEKGTEHLIFQQKVMGSRAYILWFKDFNVALDYGYNELITINSRNGYQFFEDAELLEKIWFELNILAGDKANMMILDTEITPWIFKAKGLIKHQFDIPLQSEFLHHAFAPDVIGGDLYDVYSAMINLRNYTKDEPIKVNIFDVIALNGENVMNNNVAVMLRWLEWRMRGCNFEFLRLVEWSKQPDEIVEAYANDEGIVIKPENRDGMLPALKVRNRDYLRLVMGSHYGRYLPLLKERGTNRKRKASHGQYEIAKRIVDGVVSKNHIGVVRNIGLFLANEQRNFGLDNTL